MESLKDPVIVPKGEKEANVTIDDIPKSRVYSNCPTLTLNLGGLDVQGLMDMGSQISIISEKKF